MVHKVVVLGAGYAGFPAALRLARQVRPEDLEVVVVADSERFVERPRLHQLATGQRLKDVPLRGFTDPTGITLVKSRVVGLDPAGRTLSMLQDDHAEVMGYDTLVYALGSTVDTASVPGVVEHAYCLGDTNGALQLHRMLRRIDRHQGTVVVCGGGMTGIETAAEVAESFPGLQVRLVSASQPGEWLSTKARRYLGSTLDRLHIEATGGARVVEVLSDAVRLADGRTERFDVCIWAGGFVVPELAASAGLATDPRGRIITDRDLRSVSDRHIYAIGDAAAIPGPWGSALAMGCRTGGFTGPAVADNIAAELTGRAPSAFSYRYFHECISLGRHHGVVQFLEPDGTPKARILTGRAALAYKEATLKAAIMLLRNPGPFPRRRRAVARTPQLQAA